MTANKKIVCFSDTHGQHRNKKLNSWLMNNSADILLFAGDYQKNNQDHGKIFVEWIAELPYKHKIIIPGNHDNNFDNAREKCKHYDNIHFIVHEGIEIEGIKFFCSAYSRTFGNWYFMESEDTLKYLYEKIPNNTEILVTHTPPFGTLDETIYSVSAGSTSLNNRIPELPKLEYNIFGHIHEQNGFRTFDDIKYINCSVTNELYELVNNPYIFEFEKE